MNRMKTLFSVSTCAATAWRGLRPPARAGPRPRGGGAGHQGGGARAARRRGHTHWGHRHGTAVQLAIFFFERASSPKALTW